MSKYRNPTMWQKYKKVCAQIWEEREKNGMHFCEICGRALLEPKKWNFHHLAKRTKNLLNKKTIILTCWICHNAKHGIKEYSNLDN